MGKISCHRYFNYDLPKLYLSCIVPGCANLAVVEKITRENFPSVETVHEQITNIIVSVLVYQAWSSIVYQLIPNVTELEDNLSKFADIIDGDEVLLFERATFLVRHSKFLSVFLN